MKAAKKDNSGVFDSILVHFRADKARFRSAHLKFNRSIITVPTAWHFKPLTEIGLKLELPFSGKNGRRLIDCRGIIVECRPLKRKGHYHTDLLLTHIPSRHEVLVRTIISSSRPSLR